jgi:hypothetical protein
MEVRGLGIRQLPYEPMAVVSWVVDLDAATSSRMPERAAAQAVIAGVTVPRLAVARGCDPLPMVLAALTLGQPWTAAAGAAEPAGLDDRADDRTLVTTPLRAGQG